jgi:hypothetical protein
MKKKSLNLRFWRVKSGNIEKHENLKIWSTACVSKKLFCNIKIEQAKLCTLLGKFKFGKFRLSK